MKNKSGVVMIFVFLLSLSIYGCFKNRTAAMRLSSAGLDKQSVIGWKAPNIHQLATWVPAGKSLVLQAGTHISVVLLDQERQSRYIRSVSVSESKRAHAGPHICRNFFISKAENHGPNAMNHIQLESLACILST
jgi:hypothetical protein